MLKKISVTALLRGLIFTLIIGAILALITSTVFYFLPIRASVLLIMSNITLAVAVFAGGFIAASTAKCGGLAHGLALGVAVFCVILVCTLLWGSISLPIVWQKAGLAILGGGLGGLIGVR